MDTLLPLKTAPDVKRVILAAFPGYRKQQAFIGAFHPLAINSYWDGGSKTYYALVDLSTMRTRALPTTTHPYFDIARNGLADQSSSIVESDARGNITLKLLPPGFALISAGTFCGKPATAHVYLNSENLPKYLPEVSR